MLKMMDRHHVLPSFTHSSRSILRMEAREGASLEVFLDTGRRKPASIAIDPCSRCSRLDDDYGTIADVCDCEDNEYVPLPAPVKMMT